MSPSAIDILRSAVPWASQQLRKYLLLLITPPLACGLLALGWVLFTPQTWKAYQSLLIRDDLLGNSFKPGRFSSLENQKSAQETILHIARKPQVVRAAIEALGADARQPPDNSAGLSEQVVEDARNAIAIVAANGAEFGKTDVLVLSVKSKSRDQACRFADSVTGEIEKNLREVRHDQLRSMQSELELSVQQLAREYELIAEKVREVELAVGSDLPVLRSLLDRATSASDVQRALEQIRQERRVAENELEVARKQIQLLLLIESDPAQFSVSSSELLTMQPIFKKLREGLTDAELRLLTESGKYEPSHPSVVHAREVIEQTRIQIRHEAQVVLEGLRSQESTAEAKLQRLLQSERQYDERLARLGQKRVEYETLALEMQKRGEILGKAKTDLAQIQSLAEAAERVSLITRIGPPQADLRPDGLSKKATMLLAVAGGLIIGGGLVGLFYRPDPNAPWLLPRSVSPRRENSTPDNGPENANQLPQLVPEAAASENVAALVLPVTMSAPQSQDRSKPLNRVEPDHFVELKPTDSICTDDVTTFIPRIDLSSLAPKSAGTSPAEQTVSPPASAVSSANSGETQSSAKPPQLVHSITLGSELSEVPAFPQTTCTSGPPGTINLDALKQTLAEAARANQAPAPTNPSPEGLSTAKGQESPSSKETRTPSLTDRIDVLSESLSSYCETFHKDFSGPGNATSP